MSANIGTHVVEALIHVPIAISQHADAQLLKLCISLQVFLLLRALPVLHPVNFNRDPLFGNKKIEDEIADIFLAIHGKRKLL